MGFFDNLFKRKNNSQPVQEPHTHPTLNPINYIQLQRNDGSIVNIAPQVDKMGYQIYSQIYNSRTHELQLIPRFWVMSDELQALSEHSNLIYESLLIDIDPNILQNPYYASKLANSLLSANRMSKIMNQYHKYAGGLQYDEQGNITGKYIDPGIVNSLEMDKQQRIAEHQAFEEQEQNRIRAHAQNIEKHIETNAEGILTPDMIDYR